MCEVLDTLMNVNIILYWTSLSSLPKISIPLFYLNVLVFGLHLCGKLGSQNKYILATIMLIHTIWHIIQARNSPTSSSFIAMYNAQIYLICV